MSKKLKCSMALLIAICLLIGCKAKDDAATTAVVEKDKAEMTDVGTLRSETLIVDMLNGGMADPDLVNPYLPGSFADVGFHQLVYAQLWEIDTINGVQIPDLAVTFPVAMDDTNTKFTFKIREGLTWSDGEPFTAHDVAYTSDMLLSTPALGWSGYYATMVKSMKAIDDYTIELETVNPEAKIEQKLGVVVWGNNFRVMPKHIWEKENPATFKYTNPLSIGPYTIKDRDPMGNWFLYEKRADWEKSNIGHLGVEPAPEYILFKYFGTEEKRIIAAINNEIDILNDISPESWDILREKNPNAKAWYEEFPYGDMDDPAVRGISVNILNEPYDNANVRWALALSTDILNVSMSTFGGMLRATPVSATPSAHLQSVYHKPMTEWLNNFAFEDGYKPFDPNYARDIVEILNQQGVEGLPTTDEEIVDVFGVGWWKYDVEKAVELLLAEGFTQKDDKWMLPNGEPWQMTILAPAGYEILSMRLAFSVADSWQKFGIDAQVKQVDSATYWTSFNNGSYDVGAYWPTGGLITDTSASLDQFHSRNIVENGKIAGGNQIKWSNSIVDRNLEELANMPSDDPEVVEKITEIYEQFVIDMPTIGMFGTSKFVPVVETYWTGFQTAENDFEGPWWWWSQFKLYLPHIKPAS